MIYLSRLWLNPRSTQAQAELHDPYQLHRTISKAFGSDDGAYAEARCLFRVEAASDDRRVPVLVQSRLAPDWTRLTVTDRYLLTTPEVKACDIAFQVGQRLAFRMRANPTVKRAGKRYGLYQEPEQLHWLARKGEQHGFTVCSSSMEMDRKVTAHITHAQSAELLAVTFDGLLQVTDPDALLCAIEGGIGSGKGLGFGLLSLARLRG